MCGAPGALLAVTAAVTDILSPLRRRTLARDNNALVSKIQRATEDLTLNSVGTFELSANPNFRRLTLRAPLAEEFRNGVGGAGVGQNRVLALKGAWKGSITNGECQYHNGRSRQYHAQIWLGIDAGIVATNALVLRLDRLVEIRLDLGRGPDLAVSSPRTTVLSH
jgi:hypothetical protein